jgi:hypothetical protein
MTFIRIAFFLSIFAIFGVLADFGQATGGIGGSVTDSLGAIVPGASITAVAPDGTQKQAVAGRNGEYSISGLKAGVYTVRTTAQKFALYENTAVEVTGGQKTELIIVLTVSGVQENVDVKTGEQLSTDPNTNASATVLKDKDIEALPDDPDQLAAALQAMAGAGAGPDGGQILIDGFSGGQMPPKEAIREIRINQNPFSAEYDRVGFGRIEILTKPGFDKFHGGGNFNFNDARLNSRNPFALNRAPSQTRSFGGYLSGPISAKKSSFFLNLNQSTDDSNTVIGADILDASGNFARFDQDIRVPSKRFSISPRVDFQINDKNTLQSRYAFSHSTSENFGGGFTLPSRATNSESTQHTVQLTESMIINPMTVNETRFQFDHSNRVTHGTTAGVAVNVSSAFNGGGSQIGTNFTKTNRWEVTNTTTTSIGKAGSHAIKFGMRVRGVKITDQAQNNYGGSFTFAGFAAPGGDPCDLNTDLFVSSLEQYRCKALGNPGAQYNPSQFTLTAGNPIAAVSQVDYSPFFTDDWKARKDMTLSFGLRYENQSNIHSNMNFAPRFGIAWSPGAGGAKPPKTVFRGGGGVFYDRFGENQTLRAIRQNGTTQLSYLVTNNPAILGQAVFSTNGSVTNVPTADQLAAVTPLSSIPYRVASDLQAPYSIQWAGSIEHQFNPMTNVSLTYTQSRSLHTFRVRNINAPICPDVITCPLGLTTAQIAAHRPDPTQGNIYQVESSGASDAKFVRVNFRTAFAKGKYSLAGGYVLGWANGTSDSLSSIGFTIINIGFPAYTYDLRGEGAPAAFLPRQSFFMFASFALPWGVRASPIISINSGRHFNIVTGVDTNYDSVFVERPTFAALSQRCQELSLTNAFCNMNGISNLNAVIPRNYGYGPGSFVTMLNFSKTFGIGGGKPAVAAAAAKAATPAGGQTATKGGPSAGTTKVAASGGGGPVMMMMGPGGPMGDKQSRYQLTFGVNVQNLFNTVNLANPISSLSSPSFGQTRSTSGGGFGFFGGGGSANRRVDLTVRFGF